MKTYRSLAKEEAKNPTALMNISKDIVQTFPENMEMLKDASEYAIKVDEIKNDHESLNFVCNIYMFQNDYASAIKYVEKRKSEAAKKGEDTAIHDNLLKYLEGKKT